MMNREERRALRETMLAAEAQMELPFEEWQPHEGSGASFPLEDFLAKRNRIVKALHDLKTPAADEGADLIIDYGWQLDGLMK